MLSFSEQLIANATQHNNAPFLVFGNEIVSFAEFRVLVEQKATILAGNGVSRYDIVPFQAQIDLDSLIKLSAILWLGAVACPFAPHQTNLVFPKSLKIAETDSVANQPATIVLTSGSSGSPKAAVHSWGNHVYSALGSLAHIPLAQGDSWQLALPLYHVSGLSIFFRCLLNNAECRMLNAENGVSATINAQMPNSEIRKSPHETKPTDEINSQIRKSTHFSFVAKQLRDFLSDLPSDTSRIKHILLGGSAIPPALIEEALSHHLPIHLSYGMTEMTSQIATTKLGDSPETLCDAAATVLPFREVRITDDGEIWVRGETRFLGYLNLETAELVAPFDEKGWFPTKDLGKWVADGRLQILGRKDNMFISGGENIQPEEIERVLLQFVGITQAVVVPQHDATWGFRPVAFLEGSYDEAELRLFLAQYLPKFKIPMRFLPLPEMQSGMKIKRKDLMDRL